jgi:hydroxymethylbilane synthase
MSDAIRIGSRKSRLAMWQSAHVAGLIDAASARRCDIVPVITRGDVTVDRSLPEIGGKGLFTEELEQRLLAGMIDLAVHSLKDLPTDLPEGLTLGAVTRREDPRDVLVSRAGGFDELPAGARVGTGSLRRRAQLLRRRPDLTVLDIRGNVPTRLDKLDRGDYDAIVLAAAGLNRLGLSNRVTRPFEPDDMVPAPGQGALGVECRADDADTLRLLESLHDENTAVACSVERRVLDRLGGGCNTPVGVHAACDGAALSVVAVVADRDGARFVRESAEGTASSWEPLADGVVARLVERGAGEIIESSRDVD